jgi:hypothetical protein
MKTAEKTIFERSDGKKPGFPLRENIVHPALDTPTLSSRLRAFMSAYNVSRPQLAEILKTPIGTLNHWLYDDVTPPGVLGLALDLLEQSRKARIVAGVYRKKSHVRGRPFQRGNDWRFIAPGIRAIDAKRRAAAI